MSGLSDWRSNAPAYGPSVDWGLMLRNSIFAPKKPPASAAQNWLELARREKQDLYAQISERAKTTQMWEDFRSTARWERLRRKWRTKWMPLMLQSQYVS